MPSTGRWSSPKRPACNLIECGNIALTSGDRDRFAAHPNVEGLKPIRKIRIGIALEHLADFEVGDDPVTGTDHAAFRLNPKLMRVGEWTCQRNTNDHCRRQDSAAVDAVHCHPWSPFHHLDTSPEPSRTHAISRVYVA